MINQTTQPIRAVYSVADSQALLLVDCTDPQPIGTLSLRVGPKQYVKFRKLQIQHAKVMAALYPNWLPVGTPPEFFIDRDSLTAALNSHNDVKKFGPFEKITTAMVQFEKNSQAQIVQIASQTVLGENKLTTSMDALGQFRVVTRRQAVTGTFKRIDEDTILSEGGRKVARAKIREPDDKEDPAEVTSMKKEANWSRILNKFSVPHILHIETCPSQNQQKIRLDMPWKDGGDFAQKLQLEALTHHTWVQHLKYAQQIAEALAEMHRLGFRYNDLKPGNILFDPVKDEAILTDFAEISTSRRRSTVGTFPAPEYAPRCATARIIRVVTTQKNDCWAYGLLLYAMLYGPAGHEVTLFTTWRAGREQIVETAGIIKDSLPRAETGSFLHSDRLIIDLLSENPAARPTMKDVVTRLQLTVANNWF